MSRSADRAVALLMAVAAAAYLLPLRHFGLAISDDGWYLVPVVRMLDGAILYRDLWTFYAPLEHHLLVWWFGVFGASIVAARTLFVLVLVATAVLTYRLTRRFAPPALAWLPAALYAFAPGPWPKAFFGLCTAGFFVALARALERPGAVRFAVLGAVAGATLATRQDLGVAQIAIAMVAAPLPALLPRGFGERAADLRRAARWTAAALGGVAAVVAPVAGYYAAHGALRDLFGAVFARAAAQLDAFPPALPVVLGMQAGEGRGVALLMLLPLVLYPALGLVLLRRLQREGVQRANVLLGALLAYAVAMLSQAYHPVLLVRFLQSAILFYVLATAGLAIALARARRRAARVGLVAAGVAAALAQVWLVLVGVEDVHPSDLYTGSARVLHYETPLDDVLGDTLQVGWGQAEEVRLVRDFFATHTQPGEPTAVFPMHPLYWVLVDRPSPIRFLADHAHGNFVMSEAQKQIEADRLLASPARYVIAEQQWYAQSEPTDPLRQALWEEFRPVRAYQSMAILERDDEPAGRRLGAILRRTVQRRATLADVDALRDITSVRPAEPLPWKLLGALAPGVGADAEAIDALHRAAELDPGDVALREQAAALLIEAGRPAEAAADLQHARSLRESPAIRDLMEQLEGTPGVVAPGAIGNTLAPAGGDRNVRP